MKKPSLQTIKDSVWLILGAGGAINELFIRQGAERPYALAFCATMLGIPVLLSFDRKKDNPAPEVKP